MCPRGGVAMRGVVVYDSYYGNTKKVAEAIAEQIKSEGHEVDLRSLREKYDKQAQGDFIFIGSPTRMGKMTRRAKGFVKKMDMESWKEKPVVTFDTIMPMPEDEKEREKARKWIENGAAPKLSALAKNMGLATYSPPLRVEVTGIKGPLSEGALDKAKGYTNEFLRSLGR